MSTVEDANELERLFKAVAAAATQTGSLFAEIGKAAGETVTVQKRIDGLAAEVRKADPSLTPEQAVARVLHQTPHLYLDYLKETRA
jgi:hypothetical protein